MGGGRSRCRRRRQVGRRVRGGSGRRIERCDRRCVHRAGLSPRAVQREFWRLVPSGVTTVQAAESLGVSWPVEARWSRWRHAANQLGRAHGSVVVVRGAEGDRAAAR